MNEPRIRIVDFELVRASSGPSASDGLTLEGYAAVFGVKARIWDPWDGEYDEQFKRGAFAKTIKERTPYLMFQHGRHPLIGALPIGSIESLSEDDRGLHVVGRLHDNWLVEPVRDAIASGSIDGMSIMFEPMKETRDETGDVPLVTRTEVKLLELGPVPFPVFDSTEVGVRSALNDMRLLQPLLRAGSQPAQRDDALTTQSVGAGQVSVDPPPPTPEAPASTDATSPVEAAAEVGTSDEEAGDTEPQRSVPTPVLEALMRHRLRRPTGGKAA